MTERGGPWTRHGYAINGITVVGPGRPPVEPCGGPDRCSRCASDAEVLRASKHFLSGRPTPLGIVGLFKALRKAKL